MTTAKRICAFHDRPHLRRGSGRQRRDRQGNSRPVAQTVGGIMDALLEYAPERIERDPKISLDGGRFRFVIGSAHVVPAKDEGKPKKPDEETSRSHVEVGFPRVEEFSENAYDIRVL